jgi:CBS domain containing-hemolysin-like protein
VFGDRRAGEVMTPRSEINFATIAEAPRDIAEKAMTGGHTRLPLCDTGQGLEDAVGFINAKDLLRIAFGRAEIDVRALARPLARVAESTRLDEALREMRRDRRHLALVLDEHGTVVGLITLEDILEELVGEIEDEFDPHARELIRPGDGGLRIDGAAPLRLVAERLGMDVDAPHEATIGGHVAERLGRLPDQTRSWTSTAPASPSSPSTTHASQRCGRNPHWQAAEPRRAALAGGADTLRRRAAM